MPRSDKSKYTDKQKRKAEHIEESYESRGVPEKEAARRAWATVNKESGGGNKSGSGRGVADTNVSTRKGGKKGGAASAGAIGRPAFRVRAESVGYPQTKCERRVSRIPRHQ
jgi:plasmid stabilization system protein ParE